MSLIFKVRFTMQIGRETAKLSSLPNLGGCTTLTDSVVMIHPYATSADLRVSVSNIIHRAWIEKLREAEASLQSLVEACSPDVFQLFPLEHACNKFCKSVMRELGEPVAYKPDDDSDSDSNGGRLEEHPGSGDTCENRGREAGDGNSGSGDDELSEP
jgi:hypothetical protein